MNERCTYPDRLGTTTTKLEKEECVFLLQRGTRDAMPPFDYHRGSGQPMGRLSLGKWHKMTGTLLGSEMGNGTGYILGAK